MKKLLLVMFLFIPVIINASNINNVFVDSEIDIAGSINVKEIIDINDKENIIIDFKNNEFDKYKSSGIKINGVGLIKSDCNISNFYDEDFKDKCVIDTDRYELLNDDSKLDITFFKGGKYYLDYIILNVGVRYNDSSEFYLKYFNNFNKDVNEVNIVTRLQGKSELFDVSVKSNSDAKVVKDVENNIIHTKIVNYKSGDFVTINILYDRYLSSANISKVYDEDMLKDVNYLYLIIIFIVIIFITSLIIGYVMIDVDKIDIVDDKIDKNIKLLLVSDLHNRRAYKKLSKIIEREKVDYYILCGDMAEYNSDNKIFIEISQLFKNKKSFYTYGNHELLVEDLNDVLSKICKDIKIFNNDKCNLTDNISLYSVSPSLDYYNIYNDGVNILEEELKKIKKIDNKRYNILISHDPLNANVYTKYNFDLVLSGHVHGGIIKFPLIGGLLSPEHKFFPKYYNGLYNINNMKLIVSRGIGFSRRLPFRLFNTGHVIIVNLMKK